VMISLRCVPMVLWLQIEKILRVQHSIFNL
jgi:hypothetical protein